MTYKVLFSPEALEQIRAIYRFIADEASPEVARRFTGAIVTYCEEEFKIFPHRGTQRDDIQPGLRITNHQGRTIIAFVVEVSTVYVIGVFYGGQDHEAALQLHSPAVDYI